MEIVKQENGSFSVLKLKGRFDAHEAEPVNTWLQAQVEKQCVNIIVNLEGVNFVDSTALSTLVRGYKKCRENNGTLRLCSLQQPVRVIFELTRLDKAFDIFETEEEASVAI
jgi:anti-sigma B factor antagonist